MKRSVIFVRGNLESVVWDTEKNCPLANFVDGLFETRDSRVVEKLKEFGYKTLDEYQNGPPADGFSDPDRGPVIDTRHEDVKAAKSESQALMEAEKERMAKVVQDRVSAQTDDDDDVEYIPPKRRNKASKKKK